MECRDTIVQRLRGPKFMRMSIFDIALTAMGAGAILKISGEGGQSNEQRLMTFAIIFTILIIAGVVLHVLTKTPTMLNYYLGINSLDEVLDSRKCK